MYSIGGSMKKISLTEKLVQKILDYLARRPFVEVFKLIQELQQECVRTSEPDVLEENK